MKKSPSNYHQIKQIQQLKDEVEESKTKIIKFHTAINQNQNISTQEIDKINKEK